ncbi:hypothetical protein, partial [Vibrio harveyi]|uniref:hypothetical protein n=1 Tax=Vibrio harveyi TaxID=669 RepID=UPI001E3CBBF5
GDRHIISFSLCALFIGLRYGTPDFALFLAVQASYQEATTVTKSCGEYFTGQCSIGPCSVVHSSTKQR